VNVRAHVGTPETFTERFDLGIALHTCGIRTDTALQSCLSRGASYVLVPCCYKFCCSQSRAPLMASTPPQSDETTEHDAHAGGNSSLFRVPHSERYRMSPLLEDEYEVLAFAADAWTDDDLPLPPGWDESLDPLASEKARAQRSHSTDRETAASCMAYVDDDRNAMAEEQWNYATALAQLFPATCSARNHVLIGIPPARLTG
jgi:hypothetical protein